MFESRTIVFLYGMRVGWVLGFAGGGGVITLFLRVVGINSV